LKLKTIKRTACFLLALILMASLLPGSSIPAEAAASVWTEAVANTAKNTLTPNNDACWASRMQYTGLADAAGKDWTVEFILEDADGAIGVYQYDETGAMYGAYLDTNTGVLDSVRFDNWTTCRDGFYYFEGNPAEAIVKNWTAADKVKSYIRVDFIRGAGGTMAGGSVRFYKKNLSTGQYTELGRLAVSSDLKDSTSKANIFGIHLMMGRATVSKMKIAERENAGWDYANNSEKQAGKATYNKVTDTVALAYDEGWNSRMVYLDVPDVSGKAFALEFDAEMSVGGALGVMPFYEDTDNFYGVFLDRTAAIVDGVGYSSGNVIDDFNYINADYYGVAATLKNPVINWVRYRFEFFPGPGGTATGGTCKLYYKTMTEGKIRDDFWRLIGTFNLPTTVLDRAGKANKIMVGTRLMSATLANFDYMEIAPGTVTDYYNGPADPAPEDGYAKESDPLPFGKEPEIAGEVAPQALTGGGYGITTGGYTLQLYAANSGYGTQITDANGTVVQEQVNPINIQIKKPNAADDYLGNNAATEMIAANYQTVRQNGNTLIATAQVSSKAGSRFLVTDKYIGMADGGFQLNRNIRVISAASGDEGFNSIVKFKEKNAATYSGYEYFMPATYYRDNNHLPAGAIGTNLASEYMWLRDTMMPTPVVMARNKTTGNSFAMGRVIDEEVYTGIDESNAGWVVSKHLDYGSAGFSNADGYVSLDICYPGIEGGANYLTRTATFLRRSHPVSTDVVHSYRVLLQPGKAASFTDAMVDTYKGQFNANTVPEVETDIERVYDVTLDYLDDFTQEYTDGKWGMPFGQYLDGDVASLDSLIGFVGQQTTVGFHLIRNGIETKDAKQRQKGEAIIDTWVNDSFTKYGFPRIWYATAANAWAPNSFILCYVRYMSDGMEGILDAYLEEKAAGVEKTAWLNRCKEYADWLVRAQNWDGSWYRAYNPDTGKVGNGEDGKVTNDKNNTACNVRYLVRMYEQTGKQAYLTAAIKAGEFVYANNYLKETYYGGTPDGLNAIDKEAGIMAMYAFNSLYQITGDSKWLKASEHAAVCSASFVYSYDFPVWGKHTYNIYRDLVGTSGLSRIGTGFIAVDNFSAYLYYEYFKLYVFTGETFYYDLAKLIQDNTKQFVCIDGSLPYGRDGLMEEAHDVSNMFYEGGVQACLTWCSTALIDPIGSMEDAFGVKTIQEADKLGRDVLLQKLNTYGAGGKFR
jgi:hypothetical protein